MTRPLRILMVAAEAGPLAKTGGLADVMHALPSALRAKGCDVRVALPCYGRIPAEHRGEPVAECHVRLGGETMAGVIRESRLPGTDVPLYLIEHDGLFDRDDLYGSNGGMYPDSLERFAFFNLAILDGVPRIGWRPDIVHCHDWHAGLLPVLLRDGWGEHPFWRDALTLFTIHNLGYQGRFGVDKAGLLGLSADKLTDAGIVHEGSLNLMKGAIVYADRISTVSETYAREIATPGSGQGLDPFLRARRHDLSGIVNGVDYTLWNPETDPMIPARFGAAALEGKARCRAALRDRFDLPEAEGPIFAMVSRLVWDKGIDLVVHALPKLAELHVQLAVLGSGDPAIQLALEQAVARYPQQLAVHIGYDESLAHQLYAGADFFLMPSQTEPCGLSQLYALAYGAPPVVRRTGGLADTVVDATPVNIARGVATGLAFRPPTVNALVRAVERAVHLYRRSDLYAAVQFAGMQRDFSWQRQSEQYLRLYDAMLTAPVAASAGEEDLP